MDASLVQAITDVGNQFTAFEQQIEALQAAQAANPNVTADEQAAAQQLEALIGQAKTSLAPAAAAAGSSSPDASTTSATGTAPDAPGTTDAGSETPAPATTGS